MKKLIPFISMAILFTACNQSNNRPHSAEIQLLTDSTVFHNNNIYTDSATETIDYETAVTNAPKATQTKPVRKVVYPAASSSPKPVVGNSSKSNETSNSGTVSANKEVPGVQKKKQMSKAAQGAIIGGAVGAVGGAIVSKKKGVGAVIGGIAGAAGGYIIGKNKDKKDSGGKKQ